MSGTQVMQATDRDRAVATIMMAFAADPLIRWVYPAPSEYMKNAPKMMELFAGASFSSGTSHETGDYRAVALWMPPGVHADEEVLGEFMVGTTPESIHPTMFTLFEQIAAVHPQEPHWYLPIIGVDPPSQGQGLGSRLLEHALAECDAQHLPAYLESSNPRNNPLYERHGFEVVNVIQVEDAPPIWPMYRKAR